MNLLHLGAEHGVTGSCHLLQVNALNILVDCGLTQGDDTCLPMEAWPVAPDRIDFLFLTHAHIDHIGRLPELIQNGFKGEIICSHPTRELLDPMLSDAMRFSRFEAQTAAGIQKKIDRLSWGFEYGETFDLTKEVVFSFKRAGHILGSAFIRFEDRRTGRSILFSGDLGASDTPLLPDPEPPDHADWVVMESTYGDRLHENREQRLQQLGHILAQALSDGGKVFIPAFALGRTQELIYELDRLFSDPDCQARFPELQGRHRPPVYVDSPLGLEITRIYSRLSTYWNQEAQALWRKGDHPMNFKGLFAVENHRDHLELCAANGPAIILAGSGMCTGGRIVDHLRQGLEDPRNDILFVGYQADGTPGRTIQTLAGKPGGRVELDGDRRRIRARVHTLAGYSAHADQKGLVAWLAAMPGKPEKVKLVHGDAPARRALAEVLEAGGYKKDER